MGAGASAEAGAEPEPEAERPATPLGDLQQLSEAELRS